MTYEKNEKKNSQIESNNDIKVKSYIFNAKHKIKDLANLWQVSNSFLIQKLIHFGIKTTVNETINKEIIEILGLNLNIEIIYELNLIKNPITNDKNSRKQNTNLIKRAPIVVIMGHVDHGKTTLLDSIRNTRIVEQEFGGITQCIGAYEIVYNDNKITFIDSPGHEAFSKMRSRGAKITDICVIVIAGDDGVKPQTLESIEHAKKAKVDIIIAINKIDKSKDKKEIIMSELSDLELVPEEWGGQTPFIEISALKNKGIDDLLQMILLMSDVKNIQTDLTKPAEGVVLEASLDKKKGPLATLISFQGILKIGDFILIGEHVGKIRSIENDLKQKFKQALPSQPVLISGLKQVPQAGDRFLISDKKTIQKILEERHKLAQKQKEKTNPTNLSKNDNVLELEEENPNKILNIVLKADTQGSLEVIIETLNKFNKEETKLNLIKIGLGIVSMNDINIANTFKAVIINFNTLIDNDLKKSAQELKVEIKHYNIIYKMIEDIEKELKKLAKPVFEEKVAGQAEVRKIFQISSFGSIAGCYVTNGIIFNNSLAKVIRNDKVVYEGKIISLKHLKNNIKSAKQGHECGILLEKFHDFKINDIIESSKLEKVIF